MQTFMFSYTEPGFFFICTNFSGAVIVVGIHSFVQLFPEVNVRGGGVGNLQDTKKSSHLLTNHLSLIGCKLAKMELDLRTKKGSTAISQSVQSWEHLLLHCCLICVYTLYV